MGRKKAEMMMMIVLMGMTMTTTIMTICLCKEHHADSKRLKGYTYPSSPHDKGVP